MKKITMTICILLAAAVLFMVGCTAQTEETITTYSDLDGKIIATYSIPSPIDVYKSQIEASNGITIEEFLYFDTTNAAVAALKSNQIDAVIVSPFTADFYAWRDNDLMAIPCGAPDIRINLHMALRDGDTELLEMINTAIITMKEDGTLDDLKRVYITELTDEALLEGLDIPKIPDAPTFYVGISGDLPPLDYIAANGKPGGYSIAMLSEISKRAGINFEIVSMMTDAKFTALAANRIDIFFFHPVMADLPGLVAVTHGSPGVSLSEPYHESTGFAFLVRR